VSKLIHTTVNVGIIGN